MAETQLLQWVVASIVAQIVATNLGEWLGPRYTARLQPLFEHSLWKIFLMLARVAYFILVPYAALIGGFASPRLYALTGLDDSHAWGLASLIAACTFVAVSVILWFHSRTMLRHYPPGVFPAAPRRAQLSQPWGFAFILLDALCLQAHWTFYRAGGIAFLNQTLAGALGGLVVVFVEWLLNPAWRKKIRAPGQSEDLCLTMVLALMSWLMFVAASNFWLMLIAHIAVWLGWLALMQRWYKPLAAIVTVSEAHDA
jgi:hypothetical protein